MALCANQTLAFFSSLRPSNKMAKTEALQQVAKAKQTSLQLAGQRALSCGGTSPGGCASARRRCRVAAERHCWNASRISSSSSPLRPGGLTLMLTLGLPWFPALLGRRRGVGGRNVSSSE